MTWPFKVPDNKPNTDPANAEVADPAKAPEKTPAEIIAEALKPVTEGFANLSNALDARLKVVEEQTKKPVVKADPEGNGPASVFDDENVAFAQRLTPIMARQLELESRIVKNDIKSEYVSAGYGELWTQFEPEINQMIDNTPLVTAEGKPYRGDPQFVRNVVDLVMGRAARKAGMRFDGKSKGFFLETGGSGSDGPKADPADGLSDSQRKIMGRMGIPLDQAKKVMSKLQFVQ